MKIKVPNEVQHGCHKYKVFLADKDLTGEYGDAHHLLQEIKVREDLPPSKKVVAFCHENLHIINRVFSTELDEQQIEALAEGMGQLLLSNMGIELDWSGIPTKTATVKEQK